ncbi:MAG: glycosyltransferase family 1 protein [Ignavibacteria bacterium]|jgi:glycosyltransferase involved in cell wall biosynthesis
MNLSGLKISIDARMINHSGIGTYIKCVIRALLDYYELTLITDQQNLVDQPWLKKVKIVHSTAPIYSIKEQIRLPLEIPQCEIFISPHYNIPLLPIRAKKRIVIIHDVNHLVYYNQLSLVQKLYAKLFLKRAVNISDAVITVSNFSGGEIRKYIGKISNNINVLYFGVDETLMGKRDKPEEMNIIRLKYNLPDNYILYVGSPKPHKNFITLLKSFTLLLEDFPGQKLVVVGISKDQAMQTGFIESATLKNKEVPEYLIFKGYVADSELQLIYRQADFLVFPSFYEGFGLPPIEAMLNYCPVIASNAASIPEICGNAALFFDPNNEVDLYKKMKLFLSDLNLRNNFIRKGEENLTRFKMINFTSNIYRIIENTLMDTVNN